MTDLLYAVDGAIATITLNRPERLNAISVPMLDALSEALVATDQDHAVRVIVLTGAGKGLCSGVDVKDLAAGKSIGSDNDAMPVRFDLRNATHSRKKGGTMGTPAIMYSKSLFGEMPNR